MFISKRHHYLSQFYLRGFTKNGGKKSKLTVFDLKEKRAYLTTSNNVAVEKGFNQVKLDGVKPGELENELSKLEGNVKKILKILKVTMFSTTKNIGSYCC